MRGIVMSLLFGIMLGMLMLGGRINDANKKSREIQLRVDSLECLLMLHQDHVMRMKMIVGMPLDSSFSYKNKIIYGKENKRR